MATTSVQFDAVPSGGGGLQATAASPTMGVVGGDMQSNPTLAGKDWFADGMSAEFGGDLPGFLNEAFAPAIQAAKEEKMWQGFVKAREGATMQEISEEQPWYSKLFGPTPYELGATLYTTQKTVADMETDLTTRMPELRKLTPEQMGKEFNRMAQGAMTGDLYADSVLKKTFMDRAGPLMDLHTKSRIAWQQGELVKVQVDAISAASGAYHQSIRANRKLGAAAPNDEASKAAIVQLQSTLFDTLRTGKYQNDASIKDVYSAAIRGMADRGEFHTIGALLDAGILGALDPDDAQKLTSYVDRAEAKLTHNWETSDENIQEISRARVAVSYGVGGEPVLRMMQDINARYAAETGATKAYFDADELAAAAGQGAYNYIARRDREQAKIDAANAKASDAQAVEEAKARNAESATKAFVTGGFGEAVDMKHMDRKDLERAAKETFDSMIARGQPKEALGLLVSNYSTKGGKVVTMIRDNMQHDVLRAADEQLNDGFMGQYQTWKALTETPGYTIDASGMPVRSDTSAGWATTLQYYGPTIHKKMQEFDRTLRAGLAPDLAYRKVWGQAVQDAGGDIRGVNMEQTKRNSVAIKESIEALDAPRLSRWFGNGQRLHPSTVAMVSNSAAYYFEQLPVELNSEQRAQRAVHMAQQNGVEVAGRYGWVNGREQESIAGFLRDNGEKSGEVVDKLIDEALRASGGKSADDESISVMRGPDENGEPVLHVISWTPNGVVDAVIRGRDMKNAYRRAATRATTPREKYDAAIHDRARANL